MSWEMEVLSPTSCFATWVAGDAHRSTLWTAAENKVFENALAVFDESTPDRWQKVAAMVPGKTVGDVIRRYKELEYDVSSIEAGLVPLPGYTSTSSSSSTTATTTPFMLEWGGATVGAADSTGCKPSSAVRRSTGSRSSDHERKKGIPWSEEEHRLFLMGLKKYGKGDWRNISRNMVITRTPTQVASHAQKYFIRQLNGGKDKKRASIHDITTLNLEPEPSPPENKNRSPVPSPEAQPDFPFFEWNNTNNELLMGFGCQHPPNSDIIFSSSPMEANSSYCQQVPAQESISAAHGLQQMQSGFHYPNA